MKRIKRNPFGKQIIELLPITQHENGRKVWFAKLPITPDTNPVDLQALQRKQARITALLFAAANKVAKERNIPADDARALFFPQTQPDGTETVPLNFIDYLDTAQMEEFLVLQGEAANLPIVCATVFLQNRLAFELNVIEVLGAGKFKIDDPWFDLSPGDKVKFGDAVATVRSVVDDTVELIEPLAIAADAVGFLLKPDGSYLLGDLNWQEHQTRSLLSVKQIDSIYRFYEDCLNENDTTGKQPPQPTKSSDSLNPQSQTGGETSTQSAAPSESQPKMIDSNTPTLEPALSV